MTTTNHHKEEIVMTTPNFSPDYLEEYLHGRGFITPFAQRTGPLPAGHARWWDRGPARVALDDNEIVVHHFTDDRARLLVWQIRFSPNAPTNLVEAAINEAVYFTTEA